MREKRRHWLSDESGRQEFGYTPQGSRPSCLAVSTQIIGVKDMVVVNIETPAPPQQVIFDDLVSVWNANSVVPSQGDCSEYVPGWKYLKSPYEAESSRGGALEQQVRMARSAEAMMNSLVRACPGNTGCRHPKPFGLGAHLAFKALNRSARVCDSNSRLVCGSQVPVLVETDPQEAKESSQTGDIFPLANARSVRIYKSH